MRTIFLFIGYYGSVAYSLVNPTYGLLFFIHITIFRPDSLVWGNLVFGRLHLIASSATLLSCFIHRDKVGQIGHFNRRTLVFFGGLLLWLAVVTVLAEISISWSFEKAFEVAKIYVSCFLFSRLINSKETLWRYVLVISISYGALGFWGFQQGLAGNPRLDTLWPGGSNYIAAQLAMITPVSLAAAFQEKQSPRYRLGFLACALSMALCSVYTSSRGGFLGLIIGILIFILKARHRFRILLAIMVLVGVALPWIPADYAERIGSIFAPKEERDVSSNIRPVLWRIATRIWLDHPITGVGLMNFSPVKETYYNRVSDILPSEEMEMLIFNQERFPHGLYTGVLVETGIIGLVLFLSLVIQGLAVGRHPARSAEEPAKANLHLLAHGARAGLIGFCVAAFFGDFQYLEILYWQLFFIGSVRELLAMAPKKSHSADSTPVAHRSFDSEIQSAALAARPDH